MVKLSKTSALALCAVLLLSACAFATSTTFSSTVGTPNSDISGFTGPYAEVTVNLINSTTADITFNSDISNGNIFLMGAVNAVDVNVDATSWTISNIDPTQISGFLAPSCSDSGSGQVDGFGVFNQTIDCFDGYSHAFETMSFTLTNTGGTWADAASVLVLNSSNGWDAAIHAFVTSNPPLRANGAVATGFAAEGPGGTPPPASEPATLAMLGAGLAGLGSMLRRKLGR